MTGVLVCMVVLLSVCGASVTPPRASAHYDPPALSSGSTNDWCLRCHGWETMGVRRLDGSIRSLGLEVALFDSSAHHELTCVTCHETKGLQRFPHASFSGKLGDCTSCHTGLDSVATDLRFGEIAGEFQHSVHVQRLNKGGVDAFSCFTCHDPHTFRLIGDPSLSTIETQNGICLKCHADNDRFARYSARDLPDLDAAHVWLPKRDLHWEHVRCLDCHTSYDAPNRSHLILPKEKAVKQCEDCHKRNSLLLQKLYVHRRTGERERAGFMNAALFNDSYVIGATRNTWLDLFGLIAIGGAILGAIGHWTGRALTRRKGGK
jgi:hypothetical protein